MRPVSYSVIIHVLSFMLSFLAYMTLMYTVKPEIFACPLFREFRNLGKFAKITGREYGGRDDLLCFYSTVIRPVLEYACPVWHLSLTAAQTKALESLQRRVLSIIYHDGNYTIMLIRAGLDTL